MLESWNIRLLAFVLSTVAFGRFSEERRHGFFGTRGGGVIRRSIERAAAAVLGIAVLLVLTGAASLSGCDYIGTAGAPTTTEGRFTTVEQNPGSLDAATLPEASPATTEPTPATAGASAEERANLLQAMNDSFSALAAGIWLLGPPDIEELVDQSQLIVRGTVTEVDSPRASVGSMANPYIVFYVDPAETLKGSPRFGTPLPFAIPGRPEDTPDYVRATFEKPLEVGDRVLVFSSRGDRDFATGAAAPGADFLWNDTYGLFLPAGGNYVSARSPYTYTTLDEVRRIVGPDKDTSTTLAPGQLSFERKAARFEDRLTAMQLIGALPYQIMTGFDVNWVLDAAAPVTSLTAVKGYRLANGDRVFLFDTMPAPPDFHQMEQDLEKAMRAAATEGAVVPGGEHVSVSWYGGFGYIVIAGDYIDDLGRLAGMAETGELLN
jgi:hypothetical protein